MKLLDETKQLVELNTDFLTVQGEQLALEDRKTGKVYITTKPYINKLFAEMGYRSLNVVNILKEFAGKVISDVGELKTAKIYADELNNSCLIATEQAVNWTRDLSAFLDEKGFSIIKSQTKDTCRTCDEYIIKSPNGTYFAIDVDLTYETASLFSMNDIDTKIKVLPEGTYDLGNELSIDDIKATLLSKINLSTIFDTSVPLSVAEYVDFLSKLGYVRKGRKQWSITELGEEEMLAGLTPMIDINIDQINVLSWIKSHIESSGVTFDNMCQMLTYRLDSIFISKFAEFYLKNTNEQLDYFLTK